MDAIAHSAVAVTNVILGDAPPPLKRSIAPNYLSVDTVKRVSQVMSKYWKSIPSDPSFADPYTDEGLPQTNLNNLIARHRTVSLWDRYEMSEYSLAHENREYHTVAQIHGSQGLLDTSFDTVVVFAHDMGNMRLETHFPDSSIPNNESSYLVDSSVLFLDWAKKQGFGVVDVNYFNMLPIAGNFKRSLKPYMSDGAARDIDNSRELAIDILLHVWDDFIQLCNTRNIVLIGHGQATHALLGLINERHVREKTRAVIQVIGMHPVPITTKEVEGLKTWYHGHSKVILPHAHPLYSLGEQAKSRKRLGNHEQSGECFSEILGIAVAQPNTRHRGAKCNQTFLGGVQEHHKLHPATTDAHTASQCGPEPHGRRRRHERSRTNPRRCYL